MISGKFDVHRNILDQIHDNDKIGCVVPPCYQYPVSLGLSYLLVVRSMIWRRSESGVGSQSVQVFLHLTEISVLV